MNIRGIFFDLYGTLLIYGDMKAAWSDWLSAFYVCLQEQGLSVSREEFSQSCDRFFSKNEPSPDQDDLTVLERRIKTLCAKLRIVLQQAEISSIATTIANAWQPYISLDQEAIPILKSLNSHKILGLISNFDHPPHIRQVISEYGLNSLFKTIVISGDVGFKKPDPRIFSIALEETRLAPGEVVYIGDTEEDVEGAKAAAIRPILIQRDGNPTDISAIDYSVNDNTNKLMNNSKDISVITKLSEVANMFT